MTTSLREGAKEVEIATQGRVQVKIYAGGVMGSDAQVMRKMRAGQLQAATLSAGSLEHVDFSFGIIGMPMLVTTPAQADAARAAVEPELLRRMKAKGLDCTGLIEVGFIHVMGEVPVHGPADMTRIKPWLPEGSQLGQDAFSAFGVTPIPLPLPDVLTGLQTGGHRHRGLLTRGRPGPAVVHAHQAHHGRTPALLLQHPGLPGPRPWPKLSDADRKTVMDIFTRRMSEVDKSVRLENDSALQALLAQGITLEPVTPEGHARFKAVADELVERYRDEGKLDPALLEKVRAAIRAVN